MGGPCTIGPGLVVSDELKEPIRSHHDLRKELAKHVHSSTKVRAQFLPLGDIKLIVVICDQFFEEWAERVAVNGHAVDLFSCSLDQTGLLEMKQLVKSTGGLMVLADSFDNEIFQRSLQKMFQKDESGMLQMGLAGQIECRVSIC